MNRICAFCGAEFVTENPRKRYCCEQHQGNASNVRYRARHREQATCKGCGRRFTRTSTRKRKRVYCALTCQYGSRSQEYRQRPDIQAGIELARRRRDPSGDMQ